MGDNNLKNPSHNFSPNSKVQYDLRRLVLNNYSDMVEVCRAYEKRIGQERARANYYQWRFNNLVKRITPDIQEALNILRRPPNKMLPAERANKAQDTIRRMRNIFYSAYRYRNMHGDPEEINDGDIAQMQEAVNNDADNDDDDLLVLDTESTTDGSELAGQQRKGKRGTGSKRRKTDYTS